MRPKFEDRSKEMNNLDAAMLVNLLGFTVGVALYGMMYGPADSATPAS